MQGIVRLAPGLAVVAAITAVATALGALVPVVGGPVFGIVLGAVCATVLRPGSRVAAGAGFAGKRVLQASIVVLGTGLSLTQVVQVGVASLPVMLGTLAVALLGAAVVGRLLRVDGDVRTLIGVGTGICGASAIAATTAVIGAAEAEVAYAIGTIFTFNVAAVLLYPTLGHLLGLSQHAFGLWAGTAINDTSSVVAAAYTYGPDAGAYGVVVKLTRTLMIIPISIALAALAAHRERAARTTEVDAAARRTIPWRRLFPLFIVGFLAASALDTAGAIPASWHPTLGTIGVLLITAALTGIGLSTRLATLRAAGHRPLLLGGVLWLLVGATSLLLQAATGTL
ncbi:YeiH family protein [Amnibacterium kyonggiense]|uniref:Putative integral membrane protein (TIGR00698 family) n=1 Tax=Amnibacterium kyonggiense TaxID=595671 RepID=A0A4V3EAE4_9MICO|nr:putative sulfate exporter family transporter [Amnibacterium kyonggiense]TDS76088.1 putative integral membrane protein (TIGR00698 family) [Amnibacterium kyonggiense]